MDVGDQMRGRHLGAEEVDLPPAQPQYLGEQARGQRFTEGVEAMERQEHHARRGLRDEVEEARFGKVVRRDPHSSPFNSYRSPCLDSASPSRLFYFGA